MTIELSRSAKMYQERRMPESRLTQRRPGSRADIGNNLANHLRMEPPAPLPEVRLMKNDQDPDAGLTQVWPYGNEHI
jgi:hypothetical protein